LTWADAQGEALNPIQAILSRFRPISTDQALSNEQALSGGARSEHVAGPEMPSESSDAAVPFGRSENAQDKQKEKRARLRSGLERTTLYEQVWSQPALS
jgi:hypothetical protein